MDKIQQQKTEALKRIFSFAVRFLKQGDFDIARQAFKIVVRESEEKEKKEFLSMIFRTPSLRAKAERYLKEMVIWQARAEEKRKKEASHQAQAEMEKRKKTEERWKRGQERKSKEEEKKKFQKQIKQQGKEEEKEKYLRREELQLFFQKILDCYNKNEIEVAANLSEILLKELEDEKRKIGFIEKIGIINPLTLKIKRILNKIQKKKMEEEIRKRQVQKLKEVEEIIKKQKEEVKKPEDVEKQKEDLTKKYEEELKAQKEEITKKYEKELERKMNELFQKQKELKMEERELEQLENELEKRKAETKEKYEQEFEKAKKALEERQVEELRSWEKKSKIEETKETLRKKEEELKNQEAEARKIREAPEEVLTEEEKMQRKEAILKAEEEIREKRKMIEEETKRIEEEETMRKQLEEKREGPVAGEETETEKEKRRVWLKEEIEKEKEMMTPEEKKREQKEKAEALKKLFEAAIFYYKERNLDKAIEIFQELKKELPEPKKEPGFFSKIFSKTPLYIKIENYILEIKKQKILEEKMKVKEIREYARIASGEKRKEKYQFFSRLKEIASKFLLVSPAVIFRKFLFLPPLVAIDISDYSIELLRLDNNLSILTCGRSVIKEGVVSEGKIKDQKELSQAFKLSINQAGFKSFRPKSGPILRGIVSIPEYKTNVQMFTFESRDNIFEKVKEEIKKTVPFPIDELYWDYLEYLDEKSNQTKVLCVAALKDIIDEQIYFLKSSGVDPVVFDIEAASIGRALLTERFPSEKRGRGGEKKYFQKIDKDTLILDIGARVTNINIFDENGFINSSTAIPNAGHYLVDKIAEYFEVSQEEAETIMNIKGFRKEDNIILEILEKGMEKIVEETKEAIKHYHKKTGNEIKKIILSGGTALLPEIDKFFKISFKDAENIEIEIGDPLKKIKRKGGINTSKAILYANSIGLALRSIIKDPVGKGINLLPGNIKEKEKKIYWQRHRQKLIIIQIILAIIIAAAAMLVYLYII